jgi:uncharacterized protein (TIGR03437 family)
MRRGTICIVLCAAFCACIQADSSNRFRYLGAINGIGGVGDYLVGPGPSGQRYYVVYTYPNSALDVVSLDPATGAVQVFPSPAASEQSGHTMTVAKDGNLYVGTSPNAHLLRLETATGKFTDLGRPSSSESFIWCTALGADGKVYGGTYPSAKLIRYDPATGVSEDLGRMDPVEMYGHTVAASTDGFVYVGIGYGTAHLAAYQIATGTHSDILPAQYQLAGGVTDVYPGTDGKVYASINGQYFRLDGFNITPIASSAAAPAVPRNVFADGSSVSISGTTVKRASSGTTTWFPYQYTGEPLFLYRIGLGPDSLLYVSSILPFDLLQADPVLGGLTNLGQFGGGEAYSLMAYAGRLRLAAYSAYAPLLSFDPMQPVYSGPISNPTLTNFAGSDADWRPQSMIAGSDGSIYIGAQAGYGKLAGPLTVWNPTTNSVSQYTLYDDQSIISVTEAAGYIVGATSIKGGEGSHPTATQAHMFLWDPAKASMVFDTMPISTGTIANLVSKDGIIYGVAGSVFFVYDPVARQTTYHARLVDSVSQQIFTPLASSMAVGADGNLWGLADLGIFKIDLKTYTGTVVAQPPESITSGFAMDASNIYFASGSSLYSYLWSPLLVAEAATGRPFLAPDSIGSLYGDSLPAGVDTVTIHDSAGRDHAATVVYSGAGQVNFVVPSDVSLGFGQITAAGISSPIEIRQVAPGIFAATQEQPGDVTLYATGIRHYDDISQVVAHLGTAVAHIQYAGDQEQYPGLDQINLAVPWGMSGPVTLSLWVNGVAANSISLTLP